jgi:D-alanyl-D-alanine carboxypeptidase
MMQKRFFKWTAAAICTLMLFSSIPCQTFAVSTSATSAVLMDVDSGRVLYAHNETARMRIASTTKIMTALVAIEHGTLSDVVTVRREETLVEGTSMYLREGEQLTLETLLYGLLLSSGNDAALVIADAIGGSRENFVAMMNEKAAALGMDSTSFANPNGLDDENHYSTALDMARLGRAAVENETLVRIASTKSVTIGGRTLTNHNKLLSYMDGCIGLKTGYTKAAGRTLVSCAVRNGQRLVAVTLQDGNDWVDHQQLYEFGFSAYPAQRAVTMGQTMADLPVRQSVTESVPLVAGRTLSWPVGEGEALFVELELPEELAAPAALGQKVGEAVVSLDGVEVGRVDLLCGQAAPLALPEPMSLFHRLKEKLTGA